MTYRELLHKSARLFDRGKITVGEYEEMTKPLDRDIECLDKIRAEIDSALSEEAISDNRQQISDVGIGLELALSIIDKCKESEE